MLIDIWRKFRLFSSEKIFVHDLKMPLENGRADERVSRGQTNERAVCVCEVVSEEMGARRPPLPTAVVCPPGRRRLLSGASP